MSKDPISLIISGGGKRAAVLDGGFATQLERMGKDFSQVRLAFAILCRKEDNMHISAFKFQTSSRLHRLLDIADLTSCHNALNGLSCVTMKGPQR